MKRKKTITASIDDYGDALIECASYSMTGNMIYRKWIKEEKRFRKKHYEVIPLDVGVSKRGNRVLYCEDYRQKKTKMFIIKQILSFEPTKRKVKPL